MKTQLRIHRSRQQAGFTLTEIICAIGLIVSTAVPMMGLLAHGLHDAQSTSNTRTVASLRGTVRQLLRNPSWPVQSSSAAWSASALFDAEGSLITQDHKAAVAIEARLASSTGIGFDSPHLETVTVTFHAQPSRAELGRCIIQRAR